MVALGLLAVAWRIDHDLHAVFQERQRALGSADALTGRYGLGGGVVLRPAEVGVRLAELTRVLGQEGDANSSRCLLCAVVAQRH